VRYSVPTAAVAFLGGLVVGWLASSAAPATLSDCLVLSINRPPGATEAFDGEGVTALVKTTDERVHEITVAVPVARTYFRGAK